MKRVEQGFRFLVVAFMITSYLVFALIGRILIPDAKLRRSFFLRNVHTYARAALKVIGIELTLENPANMVEGRTYMILANHMSYIDAMVMAAIRPMAFVTSVEVRNTPVLGQICEFGGCLFVERRSKENILNEIGEIGVALQQSHSVVIFPEGTSTDGSKVLPFKRSLLVAAVQTRTPILPVVLQYEEIGDLDPQPVTVKNRDKLCWYGTMSFAPHFYAMMALRRIRIRVKFLPEIPVTKDSTRDTLVDAAYAAISENYQPIT